MDSCIQFEEVTVDQEELFLFDIANIPLDRDFSLPEAAEPL